MSLYIGEGRLEVGFVHVRCCLSAHWVHSIPRPRVCLRSQLHHTAEPREGERWKRHRSQTMPSLPGVAGR